MKSVYDYDIVGQAAWLGGYLSGIVELKKTDALGPSSTARLVHLNEDRVPESFCEWINDCTEDECVRTDLQNLKITEFMEILDLNWIPDIQASIRKTIFVEPRTNKENIIEDSIIDQIDIIFSTKKKGGVFRAKATWGALRGEYFFFQLEKDFFFVIDFMTDI